MNKVELLDVLNDAPCALDCTQSRPCRKCRVAHDLSEEIEYGEESGTLLRVEPKIAWEQVAGARRVEQIDPQDIDDWAQTLVSEWDLGEGGVSFWQSGDSMVVLAEDADGGAEVFDCLVRHRARVHK